MKTVPVGPGLENVVQNHARTVTNTEAAEYQAKPSADHITSGNATQREADRSTNIRTPAKPDTVNARMLDVHHHDLTNIAHANQV